MGNLEHQTFIANTNITKPTIYARCIDDIFILQAFEDSSVLKFTYELNINDELTFLDVLTNNQNNNFKTSVRHKPTDRGTCINYDSHCPDKYRVSVINNYLNRLYKFHLHGLT